MDLFKDHIDLRILFEILPENGLATSSCHLWFLSGCVQDWEHTRHLGACRAPMDLQEGTQGEHIPAECLSRNEKKATVSFYLSLTIYNGWVMWRKELNKEKVVTCYWQ